MISYRQVYKYQLAEDYSLKIEGFWIYNTIKVGNPWCWLDESKLHIKAGYAWDGPSGPTISLHPPPLKKETMTIANQIDEHFEKMEKELNQLVESILHLAKLTGQLARENDEIKDRLRHYDKYHTAHGMESTMEEYHQRLNSLEAQSRPIGPGPDNYGEDPIK